MNSKTLLFTAFIFTVGIINHGCSNIIELQNKKTNQQFFKIGNSDQSIVNNEINISYSIGQDTSKPYLLLLHGFGGNGKITWAKNIKNLSEEYNLIIPDLLWFGSNNGNITPNMDAQVTMINSILTKHNIEKINIVGISYGGFVGYYFTSKFKEKVEHLVIVNSPGPIYDLEELNLLVKSLNLKSVPDLFIPKKGEDVKRLFKIAYYSDPKIPSKLYTNIYEFYFSNFQKEQSLLINDLISLRAEKPDHLNGVKKTIIWGENDEIFSIESGRNLAKFFNCDIHVVKKSGHVVNIESSKKFNKILNQLL